jgi:hypothetical protein
MLRMNDQFANPAPTRSFRFSLKGLFAVVTIMATLLSWAGWNLNRARHRESLLRDLAVNGARITRIPARSSPFLMRTFGTTYVGVILLPTSTFSDEDVERYRETFPEARIERFTTLDGFQL